LQNKQSNVLPDVNVYFSVTVSAKESDGSVHAAIQSLVRHMLQQRRQQKKGLFSGDKTIEDKKFVTLSPFDEEKQEFAPLFVVKIPEVS
jgi:hypothetical protein